MSASSLFPGVESVGHLALPLWIAGALAAFFLVVCVIALNSDGPTRAMRILVASILVVSGALVSLVLIQGQGAGLAAQRSLVTARVLDLNTGATAQASPLSCLVGPVGEAVEASCEKSLFATPETTAAALSFVAMQVALLTQAADAGATDTPEIVGLRRVIETDRYGLAAQTFALRHGCASEHCAAFAILKDGARVRANLKTQKYDVVVRRYATAWPAGQAPVMVPQPVGALPAFLNGIVDPAAMPAPTTNGISGIDYPSAASIPPISIMNSEPVKEAAAEPAAAPAKRPQAQQARRPAPPAPAPTQNAAATAAPALAAAPPQNSAAGAALPPPMNLQQ